MAVIRVASDSRIGDRPIDPFNLTAGSRVPRFDEPVIAVVLRACKFEAMRAEQFASDPGGCLLEPLDENGLGGAIDGYQRVEAPLQGVNLDDVGMEIAERFALELTPDGLLASPSWPSPARGS